MASLPEGERDRWSGGCAQNACGELCRWALARGSLLCELLQVVGANWLGVLRRLSFRCRAAPQWLCIQCHLTLRPACRHLRLGLEWAVLHDNFGHGSTLLVLINMAIMCAPYAGQPEWWGALLENASLVLTGLFALEMLLKLLVLGCGGYWSVGWNALDGVIVGISLVDVALTLLLGSMGIKLSFLRILRMLRIVRVLRLMRAWKGLYNIVMTFIKVCFRASLVR